MRVRGSKNGISIHAIAGTDVVMLALDATEEARKDLLGFAIHRAEQGVAGNGIWLEASKVFGDVEPNPENGETYPTNVHPLQSFLWGDYIADEGRTYTYSIFPMYGPFASRKLGEPIVLEVRTEEEDDGDHAVYFNRGAVATQGYMKRFGNTLRPPEPDNPDHPQTAWLSRGLFEALKRFVDDARPGDALRVAAYEFRYRPVIELLREAQERGVDVKIVYEAGTKMKGGIPVETEATADNRKALANSWANFSAGTLIKRTKRTLIPHNKFIVKIRNGKPISVWTGSTNFSPSGFIGQANTGHLVRNKDVAFAFLDYWNELAKDPLPDDFKEWARKNSPNPEDDLKRGTTVVFSPRVGAKLLKWYGQRAVERQKPWFFTAAFGMNPARNAMHELLLRPQDGLRFVLMEKDDKNVVPGFRKSDPNIWFAIGSLLGRKHRTDKNALDLENWLVEEHYRTFGNVFYVHQKFILIDPLGDDPLVFAGSANFSVQSLSSNDENMLLIRGDTRVADILSDGVRPAISPFSVSRRVERQQARGYRQQSLPEYQR
ncbi:phospholipase D-like domain-containing protein [Ensifer adhaerens]|uniref:phospholipase D-like domain-containing protein n=1 Tax=Ensifer adhaerens TaxID=106592 RepID=UPI000DC3F464|nr:phospholipase D-like domain-containing protein [Ensifer adhaerens]RAR99352.1 phospholipase D-like protein [Ensifer adhaerens]